MMHLRTRLDGGGTPRPERWGVDSEYGTLRDVLVGPIDHFAWRAGNAVAQRAERVGLRFDFAAARKQYAEMLDAYAQAGVTVHVLPPAEGLTVYDPDVSMIGHGGGAVLCMCQALRRDHVKS
jgi:N-dimethylarginine dimethylaminohydrolase